VQEQSPSTFVADVSHPADGCRRCDRSLSVVACTKSTTEEELACSLLWCRCGSIKAAKVTSGSSSNRDKALVAFQVCI
jgi:hypothetical protein